MVIIKDKGCRLLLKIILKLYLHILHIKCKMVIMANKIWRINLIIDSNG